MITKILLISFFISGLVFAALPLFAEDLPAAVIIHVDSDEVFPDFIVETDTVDPETELLPVPLAFSKLPAAFYWYGSDNVTTVEQLQYSWRLNGSAWSDWSASTEVSVSSLIETNRYIFEVRARDEAGNIDASPAFARFTADFTQPSTAITFGPVEGAVVENPITFHWVGSDNITASTDLLFSYRLDYGIWSNWSKERTVTFSAPTAGRHHFQVRACDEAGNIDASPEIRAFIPDYTAPKTLFRTAPAAYSRVTLPVTFDWLAADNLTPTLNIEYSWRLDDGEWSPWSLATTQIFKTLAIGKHTFNIRARDLAGNIENNPEVRAFEILDPTVLDTVIISAPPADKVQQFPITFAWGGSDGHSRVNQLKYCWRVSGGVWSKPAYTTQLTLTELPWDGDHTFEVRTCDADGNFDQTPAISSFSVDSTPPNCYESWIPRQVTAGQPFTTYVVGDDNRTAATELTFRWRINAGEWSVWSNIANNTLTLTAGIHTLQIQSRDLAGNVDTTPLKVMIKAQ